MKHKKMAILLAGFALALAAQAGTLDVTERLRARDFPALDAAFNEVQGRFERGELTEFELRDAFKPFLSGRTAPESLLRAWVAASPDSYSAHLALGLHYRQRGSSARGHKTIDKTAEADLQRAQTEWGLAEAELRQSLGFTRRPYLSLLNLMSIAGNRAARPALEALLLLANEALPDNALARLRYAHFLMPRWGGSYEEMDAFIALSRRQGVRGSTVQQIEAVEHNDRGMVLASKGDAPAAEAEYDQAVQLLRKSGADLEFALDLAQAAMHKLCRDEPRSASCPADDAPAMAAARVALAPATVREGDDEAHAVVIEAQEELVGVRIEYVWLALRYPGYKRQSQGLLPRNGRWLDVLSITTKDGRKVDAYFDITSFYMKTGARKS